MICLISAFNKPNKSILLFVFVVVFAGVMASAFNISIGLNLTASMPKGFYFLVSKDRVVAGDLVSSCISSDAIDLPTYKERNYIAKSNVCDSGLAEEIKPVVAIEGDSILITKVGVLVNDHLIDNSELYDFDSNGRPINHLPIGWFYTLKKNEYFLLSNHIKRSLDSRYYGVVNESNIRKKAFPFFTGSFFKL